MIDTTTANTLSRTRGRTLQAAIGVVPVALFLLGAASASLYFWGRDLHRFTQWLAAYITLFIGQLAFYLAACYVVLRWSGRSSLAARWVTVGSVILFAIAFRAVLIPQRPYLSTDVYRYIWDGRVQATGINPYRYFPDDPELSSLRDEKIFPNISGGDHRWLTPYPPVAQAVFLLVSLIRPMSVTAFKSAMSSFDLITVLLLMLVLARSGIDPARAIIFAWHPLLIFEGSHSGHIESALITFLALALLAWSSGRRSLTGIALALATLVKFYPVILLPVFLVTKPNELTEGTQREVQSNRASRLGSVSRLANKDNLVMLAAFVATVVLAYAPYIGAGRNLFAFLDGYIQEEGFVRTGARYFLLEATRRLFHIPTNVFLILVAALFIAVATYWLIRVKRDALDVARGASIIIGLYLILTTPRYAWYYAWMLPFLCFAPRAGSLYLISAAPLLYLVWYTPLIYPEIPLWLSGCIYVPTLAWLAWEHLKQRHVSGTAEVSH